MSKVFLSRIIVVLTLNLTFLSFSWAEFQFNEVTALAGLAGEEYDSTTVHTSGVTWVDYNNDGWPDLFLVNGSSLKSHLFRNNGNGTFTKVDEYLPPLPAVEMMGSRFADYDKDGDVDIYIITNSGKRIASTGGPANLLLKNLWVENSNQVNANQPLFQESAAATMTEDLMDTPSSQGPGFAAVSGGWLDFDRDGYIDLLVTHWGSAPEASAMDRLYRNTQDGKFEDFTTQAGLNPLPQPYRDNLVAMGFHLNNDMWPDIYMGNITLAAPDFIYENQNGVFVDVLSNSPGVGDDAPDSMGLAVGDPDNDGDWDVYISDTVGNPYYNNLGSDFGSADIIFEDDSAGPRGIIGTGSWGVNFIDADHDGDEDLFVAAQNGNTDRFYQNNGAAFFSDVSVAAGFAQNAFNSRGSAVADYDGDGDLDIGVINLPLGGVPGSFQLWRNDSVNSNHWIQIKLVGSVGNTDAIGAVVRINAGGKLIMRQITGGNSAHSQDSSILHFGLGNYAFADNIEIFWPNANGTVSNLFNVVADRLIILNEANIGPNLSIILPVAESSFNEGEVITFSSTANDKQGGDLGNSISWNSNLDGDIGSGALFNTSTLSVGLHTITASVEDSGALTSSDLIIISVGESNNTAPIVSVSSPSNNAAYDAGDSISFAGTANDDEDGDLSANLSWNSSLDGVIGSGASFSTSTLSGGLHTITASVTDNGGLTRSDSISVTVNSVAGNTYPTVSISSPSNNTAYDEGISISFAGTANDAEDGDLTANLSWNSSLDGVIGSGVSFNTSTLSVGLHTITASVIDNGGLSGSDSIIITVNGTGGGAPDTIVLASIAPDDGMLQESFLANDEGGSKDSKRNEMRVGDNNNDQQYKAVVSFDTSSIPNGANILSATLRLRRNAVIGTNPFETHGVAMVDVQHGGFSDDIALQISDFEAVATAPGAAILSNAANNGDWSEGELDVAGLNAINRSGVTQLRIYFTVDDNDDLSQDIILYVSANSGDSSSHPQLVINYESSNGNTAPIVSVSSPSNNAAYDAGDSISFAGTANDDEDGNLSANLSWNSNLDGVIGSGASFSTSTLSDGLHTITASVTDNGGLTRSDSISVTVNSVAGNTTPTVSISSPSNNTAYDEGISISFAGTANDAEDGDLTANLSWNSSLDGVIGSGVSFNTSALSVGLHTITASVIDNGGLSGSDSIIITVNGTGGGAPDTIVLASIAKNDGMLQESFASNDEGGSKDSKRNVMRVGDNNNDQQYKAVVSFDTSTIPNDANILSATLRLRRDSIIGTNPFETHGEAMVDIKHGGFSDDIALQVIDFQAVATASGVTILSNAANNGDWSEGELDVAGLNAINRSGVTQLRIYFTVDDNDDLSQDIIKYISANSGDSSSHPQLVITYQ